jgi:hypothetical protein
MEDKQADQAQPARIFDIILATKSKLTGRSFTQCNPRLLIITAAHIGIS